MEEAHMDAGLQSLVLSAYPAGTRIVAVQSYRPGYLLYPAQVTVETAAGIRTQCVLKIGDQVARITHEARVLGALAELELPVPTVVAGPVVLQADAREQAAIVITELPGTPLPWVGVVTLADAYLTCQLVQDGVRTLHHLTEPVLHHPIAPVLPRVTLLAELNMIVTRGGPWLSVPLFAEAVDLLQRLLPMIDTPLVFSNGDYNPLNFLHCDRQVTGWLDFEHACFEDPYVGFAKFLLWGYDEHGWGTGYKVGLVERYLYAHGIGPRDFLPRLILRGLRHIQESVTVNGQHDAVARHYMLHVLQDAVSRVRPQMR